MENLALRLFVVALQGLSRLSKGSSSRPFFLNTQVVAGNCELHQRYLELLDKSLAGHLRLLGLGLEVLFHDLTMYNIVASARQAGLFYGEFDIRRFFILTREQNLVLDVVSDGLVGHCF